MNVSEGKLVSLIYTLNLNDQLGEVLETINKEKPLEFLYGAGYLLPDFEHNIAGLSNNQPFAFPLKSENAYGPFREEMVVDIPLRSFEVDGKIDETMIQVGQSIPMRDQSGNRMTGRITQVDEELVTMDFNHPLAGQDLYFKGEIVEVREPTEEELQKMQAHNHDGCGCSDGSCNSDDQDCGDGCSNEEGTAHGSESGCGCGH